MKNKNDITRMVRGILHQSKTLHNPERTHPARDWWIGLVLGILFFSIMAVWSYRTYYSYRNYEVSENDIEKTQTVIYRESIIEEVLNNFSKQAELNQSLLNVTPKDKTATSSTKEEGLATEEVSLDTSSSSVAEENNNDTGLTTEQIPVEQPELEN